MVPQRKFYIGAGLFTGAAWSWLIINMIRPGQVGSVCLFRNISGLPCPSCGITRSIHSLLHANLADAFAINPLGFLAMLLLIVLPFWLAIDMVRRSNSCYTIFYSTERKIKSKPAAFIFMLLIIVANWAWNIYKHL